MKNLVVKGQSVISKKSLGLFLTTVFVIIGLIFLCKSLKKEELSMDILKVAFPYSKSASEYEPTKIYLAPEYIFLESIYSSLIEFDISGNIQSGVAQTFDWHGNELHFEIRKNLKTIDGIRITAKDVEFSLKRLMVMTGNTHGNLKDILCPNVDLKSIDDICQNLEVRNDFLIIFKPAKKDVFLVKMLTALDFAIIPKTSVDLKTLKIIDYRNTTGPYFVEHDDEHGKIILAANPNHYHYSQKMAKKVELVPTDKNTPNSSLADFESGKVDFLTTVDFTTAEKIIDYAKMNPGNNLHSTINIRTFMLLFTNSGLEKLTKEERFYLGTEIKSIFKEHYKSSPTFKETEQFFPIFGEGSIDETQLKQLNSILTSVKLSGLFAKKLSLKLIRLGDATSLSKNISDKFPSISIATGTNTFEDKPDIFISGPDTGFFEDITLISYSLNAGHLGLSKEESAIWLKDYMETTEKEDRLKKLRKLHFEALMKPSVVPLMSAPYVALARKPWVPKLSKYFANNPLWQVERE
jgi:hypothetical protein